MIKKVYYVIVAIVVFTFVYYIIKYFPTISSNFSSGIQTSISGSGFSSEKRFGFKSTPERKELLKAIIELNTDFINESPLEDTNTQNKSIKSFYKLERFFADYEYYYTIKQKVENMVFEELPALSSNIIDLSNNNIEQYFNNHKKYLSDNFGISDLDNFKDIVYTLKPLKDTSITSYELENSYFFMETLKTLNIRIIFNLENSKKVYLAFQIKMQDDNGLQILPQIKIFGTTAGGIS